MLNPTQTTCSSVPLAQQILSLSTQTQTRTHHAHTHTKLKYKNLPVRSQKAFPSPSHIRCWAHRLDLKLLGAIQYGLGLEPSLGHFSKVLLSYLLSYLFQHTLQKSSLRCVCMSRVDFLGPWFFVFHCLVVDEE